MSEFEREVSFQCPFCGENLEIPVDLTGGQKQKFVYDCEVCCHPIVVQLELEGDEVIEVNVEKES